MRVDVAGVSLSHPARVVFADAGLTKLDLARYYERVGDRIVRHVRERPLTLVRCGGEIGQGCSFMKHSKVWAPPALRRVRIVEKHKLGEYLVADDLPAVLSLVQMDAIEIHTWNSRDADVERPDRVVFDLDPGPAVGFGEIVEAAKLLRMALRGVGLDSWAKTTGGLGLHVVAPIRPEHDWSVCLEFSRTVAEALVRHEPRRFTTAYAKAGREKKILLDYLRNNRTNTSIAAYSARARPGAPVSAPIDWDELSTRLDPLKITVRTLRLERRDPWTGYFRSRQRLAIR